MRDWAEGESLHDLLRNGVRLTEKQMSTIISSTLSAVRYLHSFPDPIIHRDIKPGNIIVDFAEREIRGVKVIDLDAIKKPSASLQQGWTTHIYTPGFMAPEALSSPCQQSDLFSAGAVMLHMITGENADHNYSTASASYILPPALAHVQDKKTHDFLRRCLEPSLDKRYQNAQEMSDALEELTVRK